MIDLTRLDGSPIGLNHLQIERVDVGPHTVVVMMNDNRYLVTESMDEIVDRIVEVESRSRQPGALVARRPSRSGSAPTLTLAPTDGADEES